MTEEKMTARERLAKGYAESSPVKKPRPKAPRWPDGRTGEEPEEIESIRAGLSPAQRTSVGYARLKRENER